ncbi:uncharacterized protein NPIL_278711 [Nephila pilipes]|uniref:Uncharacterized protein n=1 Tax=Nephila pilipes TaxID=299642 RepID=A0A8X6PN21_NEPPI|nr:uncharacterized protein NPIL_336411 [Nephila pilipes]GFT80421.1 uncharacterized protein NPIL_278711 [Nephila pilipes]
MSSVKDKSYDHQYKMTDVIKHAEIELSSAIRRSKSCITDIVNSSTEEKYEILNTQSNGLCEQFIHSKNFSSKLPISNFDIEKIETEEYGCTKSLSNTVLQPVSCANNFQLCSISTKGVLNVFEKNEDISSELYIPINNIEMNKIESEECKCAKLLNTDLKSPNCADNFQLCSILTDEVLNVFEKNEIFTISEQLNIYKPNSNESKIVYIGSDGKSTVSSHKENRHSYCDITQKKNNSAPENYSEKKISNKQSSDSSFRKTFSCIFTSNCTLQKEKAVSCFQIDTLFQDIDLFKQGGVLFHYYEHLKATGDHALNLNDINEDMSNLNGEVLESYIFLKNQLNYHKDVLRGLVHLSSEPGTCFKSNLIHDIVLQLDYIEGYDLACKAILL